VVDRFTHYTRRFLEGVETGSNATLAQLFASCAPLHLSASQRFAHQSLRSYDPRALQSTAVPRTELFGRPLSGVRVTDFLGSVPVVELTPGAYPGFGEAAEA